MFKSKKILDLIQKNFSLDARSLALFRVSIAVILIVDFLFTRLPYFTLFYTEKGLIPIKDSYGDNSYWEMASSLNFISSFTFFQWGLLILALVFFLMLLGGYKTKYAIFGSWILLISFQARNYLVINAGDVLLNLLLFWSLCLPLGKYFSIDKALSPSKKKEKVPVVFSINSFAFIVQILIVYLISFILKSDPVWKNNQGVELALMLDAFRTQWGDVLLLYPGLMKVLSFITYYVIESSVLFLFVFLGVFWRFRIALIACICLFHLSMGIFLHVGLFSWICVAGWLAFLPPQFWERAYAFLPNKALTVYYDDTCFFCRKAIFLIKTFLILPHVDFFTAQSDKKVWEEMQKQNSWLVYEAESSVPYTRYKAWTALLSRSPLFFYLAPVLRIKFLDYVGDKLYGLISHHRSFLGKHLFSDKRVEVSDKKVEDSKKINTKRSFFSKAGSVFFFICFIYVLMWNVRTTNFDYYSRYMPQKWNQLGAFLHLGQYWGMFAPKPLDTNAWLILSAERRDTGEKIDLWRGGKPLSMEKPYRYDETFPVFRFRKLMENLMKGYPKYGRNYLKYLCRKWNKKNDQIKKIHLIYMQQTISSEGLPPSLPKKNVQLKQNCPKIFSS